MPCSNYGTVCFPEDPPELNMEDMRFYQQLHHQPVPLEPMGGNVPGVNPRMMVPRFPPELCYDTGPYGPQIFRCYTGSPPFLQFNLAVEVTRMLAAINQMHIPQFGQALIDPFANWDERWVYYYRRGMAHLRLLRRGKEYLMIIFARYMFTWRGHAYALMLAELGRLYPSNFALAA